MKVLCAAATASLALALCGCKPDAAVKRGSVIDAGPQAAGHGPNGSADAPVVAKPTTDHSAPVKQVAP